MQHKNLSFKVCAARERERRFFGVGRGEVIKMDFFIIVTRKLKKSRKKNNLNHAC